MMYTEKLISNNQLCFFVYSQVEVSCSDKTVPLKGISYKGNMTNKEVIGKMV